MNINTEKAIEFLLSQKYFDEFEVIDGLSQHPRGMNFVQWLESHELLDSPNPLAFKRGEWIIRRWSDGDVDVAIFDGYKNDVGDRFYASLFVRFYHEGTSRSLNESSNVTIVPASVEDSYGVADWRHLNDMEWQEYAPKLKKFLK